MADNDSVCAVVVTYNRKDLLLECLEALLKQTRPIQGMYIIDNFSTDGTPNVLLEKGYIFELPPDKFTEPWEREFEIKNLTDGSTVKVHYVRMHENTGGAGGFYEGVKRGYEKGYDWLWLMDDDIEPDINCLLNLSEYFLNDQVLVPLRLSKNGQIKEYAAIKYDLSNPFIKDPRAIKVCSKYQTIEELPIRIIIQDFSFEGPIINRKIIAKIGYPKKDFFIYADDTDYAFKVRYFAKENIYLIKTAVIFRKLDFVLSNEITWKNYYSIRNVSYLHFKYGENFFVKLKPYLIFCGALFKNFLKLNPKYFYKKFKLYFYALLDAKKNPMPQRFKPGDNF